MNSPQWKELADRVKQNNCNTCEICGNEIETAILRMKRYEIVATYYNSIPNLVRFIDTFDERKGTSTIIAHHKTYERLGKERESDIAVVCVACHVVITEKTPRQKFDNASLDKAWEIAQEYMANLLQQIEVANKAILKYAKFEEEVEEIERAETSYAWLRPPKN